MDHNRITGWLEASAEPVPDGWLEPGSGTDNALGAAPSSVEHEVCDRPAVESATPVLIPQKHPLSPGFSIRLAYFAVLGAGLLFAILAVYMSTRVLPRFTMVQQRYGFQLPAETRVALRSGMLQPIPGCAVMLAGLTGLLARAPTRRHAIVTAILLLAAIAVPFLTAAALLIPELTLV